MFQHFYLKYKKFIIKSAGDRFELPLPDHESSMQPLHQPAFYLFTLCRIYPVYNIQEYSLSNSP